MTLENIQRGTNAQRVAAGNVSASNDPTQWQHDGREQLIKGAELAAAGRTLGMSEEETLAAVSRQYRRQRRADDRVTPQDVVRQMTQSLATTREVAPSELKGLRVGRTTDEAFAFGEDVDYNYVENGQVITRADDEQTYRPNDRGFTEDELTGQVRRETFSEQKGQDAGEVTSKRVIPNPNNIFRPTTITRHEGERKIDGNPSFAPNNVVRDALNRVQQGTQTYGYDAIPGSADVEGRLEAHLRNDIGADISIARETAQRDNQRFSDERKSDSDFKAQTDARAEGRRLYGPGGYGRQGDVNLSRVRLPGEVQGDFYGDELYLDVLNPGVRIQGEVARRSDGVAINPDTNDPIAVQGPEAPPIPFRKNSANDWRHRK